MFRLSIEAITVADVEAFCREYPEGVRVEYKRTPVHISKTVSSLANTVGGIWVIGVETDPGTNMPRFPLAGLPRGPGLEEQIVRACQDGIYPPITPSVRVLDLPGAAGQVVIVVRVPESLEAPHAIENSTRTGKGT